MRVTTTAIAVLLVLLAGVACACQASPARTTESGPAAPPTPVEAAAPFPAAILRTPLVVFAAGSLIVPFADLEDAFEAANPGIDVLAEYHGSIQVIRHATELHTAIDVVATADSALVPMLMYEAIVPETGRPYADWHVRFASNRLALAHTATSKYSTEIDGSNWPVVLARPDVRVGLADPRFDAAGYRGLMAFVLAQAQSGQHTYFRDMFDGQFVTPVTLFEDDDGATVTVPEVLQTTRSAHLVLRGSSIQLVALLQSGDLDYAFEYESVIEQRGLQMLRLPDEVNLGSEDYTGAYGQVVVDMDFRRFATVKPQFRGEQIGYGITVPSNAPHPEEAARFIAFVLGPEGRDVMARNHHPMFDVPVADGYDRMPAMLQPLARAESTP